MTAIHVDPDHRKSPISIYINDTFIDFLNDYYFEENLNPYSAEIRIREGILKAGENKLKIIVTAENGTGSTNIDDFEFWDLKVKAR